VGVIIGKGGDTIKYLQVQSGAKIQVTRDMDADPNSPTRSVEIQGTPEQIAKAEQLISEVLAQVYFLPSPPVHSFICFNYDKNNVH
jgi:far upstream element-binding protein